MVTKNWKNYINCAMYLGTSVYGYLPAVNVSNTTYYISGIATINNGALALSATAVGISVGTGDTAATDDDYNLEATITTGLTATVTIVKSLDNGSPVNKYRLALTNTTGSDIVIKEVGYKANINCVAAQAGTTGQSNRTCLLDRTVLATPLTVPAGGNAVLDYTLKAVYS